MRNTAIAIVVWLVASLTGRATSVTSHLLIQGPFGAGAALETHQWKVRYDSGQLSTGQDLLAAVFGQPVLNGTYTDAFSAVFPYYSSGNSIQGAGYLQFNSAPGLFVESFTVRGTKVAQPTDYSSYWSYHVAGGAFPPGSWLYSGVGVYSRAIGEGSFDAFVFGPDFPIGTVVGAENAPVTSNFAGASFLKKDSGTLTLTGVQNYSSLILSGGTTNLATTLGTGTSAISVSGNTTLNITASQTLSSLTIGAGAVVRFSSGGGGFAGDIRESKESVLVPEPGVAALLACGAAIFFRRRHRFV